MELKESLAAAGLLVLEECGDLGGLVPPLVTGQAPSCPLEDGRTESLLDIEDPLLLEKANADWYRLSVEAGLFTETDRRFLVALTLRRTALLNGSAWNCRTRGTLWGEVLQVCSAVGAVAPNSACSRLMGQCSPAGLPGSPRSVHLY